MKIVGLMACRNEDWILPLSLRVALKWCDAVVVMLHACTDNSGGIFLDVARELHLNDDCGRVLATSEPEAEWNEMQHRQRMLEMARSIDATHIAMIDADEVLTADLVPFVRNMVEGLSKHEILMLPGYNMRGPRNYHFNGLWGNRWFSAAFVDDPACSWTGDQFHHREPFGHRAVPVKPVPQQVGGILHYWGYDQRRLRAKHALYKITERLRDPTKQVEFIEMQYNQFLQQRGDKFAPAPEHWLYPDLPQPWLSEQLYPHPPQEPLLWQEAECRRLVALHGREVFAGLSLFGVTL